MIRVAVLQVMNSDSLVHWQQRYSKIGIMHSTRKKIKLRLTEAIIGSRFKLCQWRPTSRLVWFLLPVVIPSQVFPSPHRDHSIFPQEVMHFFLLHELCRRAEAKALSLSHRRPSCLSPLDCHFAPGLAQSLRCRFIRAPKGN